tara:strand:- start:243 stop:1373 length:1131 start_codon:yes stop_codon:yes gene_type:complete
MSNFVVPEEFIKIIDDFTKDILLVFPEYEQNVNNWWNKDNKQVKIVFDHCLSVYPEKIFDIFYKNEKIFDNDINFLPNINFKELWKSDISKGTKDAIWKYLKIILFLVLGNVQSSSDFGKNEKLFEAISQGELKGKLEETFENFKDIFKDIEKNGDDSSDHGSETKTSINVEEVHAHINDMMKGKIGKLALELAHETADDLGIDISDNSDNKEMSDVFKKMFNDPQKLLKIAQNIGDKIKSKISSGELKESELMEEGLELMDKMKNIPGMGNMKDILGQMSGMPGMGKGKINTGALKGYMEKNMKVAKMRERLKEKAKQRAIQTNIDKLKTEITELQIQQQKKNEEELMKFLEEEEKNQVKQPKPLKKGKKGKNKK